MFDIEMCKFFGQEQPEIEIKELVAELELGDTDFDAIGIFKTVERGVYLVVEISGCSCWPGRGTTRQTICHGKREVDRLIKGDEWVQLRDEFQAAFSK